MKKILLALCLLSLAACAGPVTMAPQGSRVEIQQEVDKEKAVAYKKIVSDQDRVFNLSFPLFAANAGFCPRTAPALGMTAWSLHSVPTAFRRAAQQTFNLQDDLAVQYVADGSPADRAGVRSGDLILAVDGIEIPPGPNGIKAARKLIFRDTMAPVKMTLQRGDRPFNATLKPLRACKAPVLIDFNSNDLNAMTDGEKIVISRGIIRFTENDEEMALIIAHELGHIAMDHVGKGTQNAMAGALGGLAIDSILAAAGVSSGGEFSQIGAEMGALQHSVGFEQEADYVGMYFMERAGFDSSNVADFWRRMAAEQAAAITMRRSHPTTPERYLSMERIHREIAAKRAKGVELAPNFSTSSRTK